MISLIFLVEQLVLISVSQDEKYHPLAEWWSLYQI